MNRFSWCVAVVACFAPLAFAEPGGGFGTTNPSPQSAPSVFTLAFSGALAGQADGYVSLKLELFNGSACPLCPPLMSETQTVLVRGGRFATSYGRASGGGILPDQVLEAESLWVRWSLASAPSVWRGSAKLSAAAAAMTLSPETLVMGDSATPALRVNNTTGDALVASSASGFAAGFAVYQENPANNSSVVRVESTNEGANALVAENTGAGFAKGITVAAGYGTGARFINTAGGDLIRGVNLSTGSTVFRVTSDGSIYSKGFKVGKKGPDGNKGADGTNGTSGKSIFNASSECHTESDDTCSCPGTQKLLVQSKGICSSTAGVCNWNGGICCVCSTN